MRKRVQRLIMGIFIFCNEFMHKKIHRDMINPKPEKSPYMKKNILMQNLKEVFTTVRKSAMCRQGKRLEQRSAWT